MYTLVRGKLIRVVQMTAKLYKTSGLMINPAFYY